MDKRAVLSVGWALVGLPLVVAGLAFGLSSPEMDWVGDKLRLVGWLVILTFSLWFGVRPFVSAFPVGRIGKVGLGIGYAVFMYFALIGLGFIAMCAHGCS